MSKFWILWLAFLVGAFLVVFFYWTEVTSVLSQAKTRISSLITIARTFIGRLPEPLNVLVPLGLGTIPTALVGLAVKATYDKAMQAKNGTIQNLQNNLSYVGGERDAFEKTGEKVLGEVARLQETVDLTKAANTNLAEANTLLGKEVKNLRDQLVRVRSDAETLRTENETLKYELKLERGEIPKPVA